MAEKQCVLSEDDIGSVEVENELSSLSDITTLVGHQVKAQNERRYFVRCGISWIGAFFLYNYILNAFTLLDKNLVCFISPKDILT